MTQLEGSYGHVVTLFAGSTACTKGDIVVDEKLSGIAADDIPTNGSGAVIIRGVVKLLPVAGQADIFIGDKVYGFHSGTRIQKTKGSGYTKFIGYALEAAPRSANPPAIDVLLHTEGEDT